MALLLLIEDERLLRWALRQLLERHGHVVHEAGSLHEAEVHLGQHCPEVVLLDVGLPDGNGLEFLAAHREALADSVVIVMTASGRIEDAVHAMKLGAFDFLSKPVNQDDLLALVDQALVRRREGLEAEGARQARETQARVNLVAESPAMKEVLRLTTSVAASAATTVLIQGETGVGKEVVARVLHAGSPRAAAPLQALNCAALPETLVESELFGHEKGAFTDAKAMRRGLFELAEGGTVVLDEIGELPPSLQAKLLRFLEERVLRRIGGVRDILVNVRVLALTNRNLGERVAEGNFRQDLFYRLNVFPITVPPLRDRREDILPLGLHFVRRFGALCGKAFTGFSADLQERLLAHPWPGNVRELRNLMERVVIMEPGGVVRGCDLALGGGQAPVGERRLGDGIVPLDEVEFVMVWRAMRAAHGNQSEAARLLGVTRDQVRYRVKRYRQECRWPADCGELGDDPRP